MTTRRTTLALLLGGLLLAACSKPIPFQLTDTDRQAALEGVRIHRHSVSIFTPLPTKRAPVETDFAGQAVVHVPPNPTCLTFLRQGFEPTSIAIFRTVPAGVTASDPAASSVAGLGTGPPGDGADGGANASVLTSADACPVPPPGVGDPCAAWQRILCWDDLMPRVPVPVRMRPLRSETVDVLVLDESGSPLPGCEVLSATFLYLPVPGVESDWGFPALQRRTTDRHGRTQVQSWSGFRNRITARAADRGEAWIDVDGAQSISVRLAPRPLAWRTQRFRVVDPKNRPIAGATLSYGEIRNGLPASPNAFVVQTDRDGRTPEVSLPNAESLLLRVQAKGCKDRTVAPLWRSLEPGATTRVMLEWK